MEQTETAFSIGEVIEALGVKLPTIDETPATEEAAQEAVADETTEGEK